MTRSLFRLVLLVLALTLAGPSSAQQVQRFNLYGPIPAGTNAIGTVGVTALPALPAGANQIGSVLADLRIAGAANTANNPAFVQVTNLPTTQPVSGTVAVSSLPSLAAGSAQIGTIGNAFALDSTLTARFGTLGQKAMIASAPVVIASDQTAIPVVGTFFQSTQPVSNAGTFAVQNTAPVVGGNATAVKTDSSATTQPVSAAALPLPAGAATSANQSSEISAIQALANTTSLATSTNIVGRIAAGQAYTESTTALGTSASVTGATRNTGYGQNVQTAFSYFTGIAFADQAGTLFVETSPDGTNWFPMNGTAGTAVAAGSTAIVKVPATTNLMRVRYTNNSSTAQTKFLLTSMFSVN